MSKKVTMSTKPNKTDARKLSADDWVSQGAKLTADGDEPEKEATARFTIDIPVSLHARIKSQCALKRVKMRDEVLSILEEKFPVN
jgi:predicted HicB family RNase H-like nuclease